MEDETKGTMTYKSELLTYFGIVIFNEYYSYGSEVIVPEGRLILTPNKNDMILEVNRRKPDDPEIFDKSYQIIFKMADKSGLQYIGPSIWKFAFCLPEAVETPNTLVRGGWSLAPHPLLKIVLYSESGRYIIKGSITLLLLLAQDRIDIFSRANVDLDTELRSYWESILSLQSMCEPFNEDDDALVNIQIDLIFADERIHKILRLAEENALDGRLITPYIDEIFRLGKNEYIFTSTPLYLNERSKILYDLYAPYRPERLKEGEKLYFDRRYFRYTRFDEVKYPSIRDKCPFPRLDRAPSDVIHPQYSLETSPAGMLSEIPVRSIADFNPYFINETARLSGVTGEDWRFIFNAFKNITRYAFVERYPGGQNLVRIHCKKGKGDYVLGPYEETDSNPRGDAVLTHSEYWEKIQARPDLPVIQPDEEVRYAILDGFSGRYSKPSGLTTLSLILERVGPANAPIDYYDVSSNFIRKFKTDLLLKYCFERCSSLIPSIRALLSHTLYYRNIDLMNIELMVDKLLFVMDRVYVMDFNPEWNLGLEVIWSLWTRPYKLDKEEMASFIEYFRNKKEKKEYFHPHPLMAELAWEKLQKEDPKKAKIVEELLKTDPESPDFFIERILEEKEGYYYDEDDYDNEDEYDEEDYDEDEEDYYDEDYYDEDEF